MLVSLLSFSQQLTNLTVILTAAEPKSGGDILETEDWRIAFEEAANARPSFSRSPSQSTSPSMNGRISSQNSNYSDSEENGDVGNVSRRTPGRLPPPPPPTGAPVYKY